MIRLFFDDLLVIGLCKAHLLTLSHLLLANLVDYKLKVVVFAALLTLALMMCGILEVVFMVETAVVKLLYNRCLVTGLVSPEKVDFSVLWN